MLAPKKTRRRRKVPEPPLRPLLPGRLSHPAAAAASPSLARILRQSFGHTTPASSSQLYLTLHTHTHITPSRFSCSNLPLHYQPYLCGQKKGFALSRKSSCCFMSEFPCPSPPGWSAANGRAGGRAHFICPVRAFVRAANIPPRDWSHLAFSGRTHICAGCARPVLRILHYAIFDRRHMACCASWLFS